MSRTSDLKPGDEADYSVLAPVPDTSDLRKLRTAARAVKSKLLAELAISSSVTLVAVEGPPTQI